MESSKCANTKTSQFEILVEYMTRHPDLSKGYLKTPEARRKSANLWTNLSIDLNAEGPPQRDGNGWKKVWADFKVHTKGKLRKNKINLSGTGGGPSKHCPLTPLEEKVAELLNLDKAVDGMTGVLNFGLQNKSNANENTNEESHNTEDTFMDNAFASILQSDNSINDATGDKENEIAPEPRIPQTKKYAPLLEKHVSNQITFQNNSCDLMKDMNENLKGILKYKRRNFEIKEKAYKLENEKFEFKKLNSIQKNKNAVAKLEIKREILSLRQKNERKFLTSSAL